MGPLKLPLTVISQNDVSRLLRELNSLDDFFVGAKARTTGTSIQPPKLTRTLDNLAKENELNLLKETDRSRLQASLKQILAKAPCLHISFAAEPSPRAVERILEWLRQNIHPQTLLAVGLQPSIAAGCVLRTPNKVFDMSLSASLNKQVPYLTRLISGAAG